MADKPATKIIRIDRSTGQTSKRVITATVPEIKDKHSNLVRAEKPEVAVLDPILLTREQAFEKADAQAKKDGYLAISLVEEENTHFAFKLSNPSDGKNESKNKGGDK